MAIKKTVYTKYSPLKKAYDSGQLTLAQVRNKRISGLKDWQHGRTALLIYSHMPFGKQVKWKEYMKLHERVLMKKQLTPLDQTIYDTFPYPNESHQDAYDRCVSAFRWIIQCVRCSDETERRLQAADTVDQLIGLSDPEYPEWPLKI